MKNRGAMMFLIGLFSALAVGWLGFPALLYRNIEQPLQFSHIVHTGENVGMACADCHTSSEDGHFTGIPAVAKCAECHSAVLGETENEKQLVEEYVTPNREIPWLVYARQPENVHFSHAPHVQLAELTCERCHGPHGGSASLRPLQRNRISGYSRDIWGPSMTRLGNAPWQGMKMDDCSRCHHERNVQESCMDCHK